MKFLVIVILLYLASVLFAWLSSRKYYIVFNERPGLEVLVIVFIPIFNVVGALIALMDVYQRLRPLENIGEKFLGIKPSDYWEKEEDENSDEKQ